MRIARIIARLQAFFSVIYKMIFFTSFLHFVHYKKKTQRAAASSLRRSGQMIIFSKPSAPAAYPRPHNRAR